MENAVGATLRRQLQELPSEIDFRRTSSSDVDYVVHTARETWAVEVKLSRTRGRSVEPLAPGWFP